MMSTVDVADDHDGHVHRLVALLLALAVVASACGGSDGVSSADVASDASPVGEASSEEGDPSGDQAVVEPDPSTAVDESTPVATAAPAPTAAPGPTATSEPAATPEPEPVVQLAPAAEYTWRQVADEAPWGRRAGLRVIELDGAFFLLGGRTPRDSTLPGDSDIFSDVWRSDDLGVTWTQIVESGGDHWAPRAYFQAVHKDDRIVVLGGQDYGLMENPFCELLEQGLRPSPSLGIDPDAPCPEFLPTSDFFNDVWASADGVAWEQLTDDAPWTERAGLSAEVLGDHIYVLGGSTNDDSSIIGPSGPTRLYYNDVWRSADGTEWELLTSDAPWSPRAGASLVAFDGALWLFGGEIGFTCDPLPDCEPPYFNDVWRSTNGIDWELIDESAGWSPRPGHQCEALADEVVCFGGFGLIENPMDQWTTADGAEWELLNAAPWNVTDQADVKYDFDSIVVVTDAGPEVFTFGGDRETFDFSDPDNWLRVDDDVWRFGPAS